MHTHTHTHTPTNTDKIKHRKSGPLKETDLQLSNGVPMTDLRRSFYIPTAPGLQIVFNLRIGISPAFGNRAAIFHALPPKLTGFCHFAGWLMLPLTDRRPSASAFEMCHLWQPWSISHTYLMWRPRETSHLLVLAETVSNMSETWHGHLMFHAWLRWLISLTATALMTEISPNWNTKAILLSWLIQFQNNDISSTNDLQHFIYTTDSPPLNDQNSSNLCHFHEYYYLVTSIARSFFGYWIM